MNFVILFCQNNFTRSKRYRKLMIINILLINDIDKNKIKNINFHFYYFCKIIMNQK